MTLSRLPLLPALVMTAACLVQAPAHAGVARATFVVSAQVVDACEVSLDGHSSSTAPAALHQSCSTGGASVGSVAANGAVTTSGKGRPFRVTTARKTSSTPGAGSWMEVTLSY